MISLVSSDAGPGTSCSERNERMGPYGTRVGYGSEVYGRIAGGDSSGKITGDGSMEMAFNGRGVKSILDS